MYRAEHANLCLRKMTDDDDPNEHLGREVNVKDIYIVASATNESVF